MQTKKKQEYTANKKNVHPDQASEELTGSVSNSDEQSSKKTVDHATQSDDPATGERKDGAPNPGGQEKPTIKDLSQQLEEKSNQLLRVAAEYDNYKKRTERERLDISAYATASLMKELLPAVDNIKRALQAEDTESPDFSKGVVLIMKQLLELLEKRGLTEINPQGQPFNPEEHEAVMHTEDDSFGENEVVEVLQRGYKFEENVLRPAMVKVAN